MSNVINLIDLSLTLVQPILAEISLKVVKQLRNPKSSTDINYFSQSYQFKALVQKYTLISELMGRSDHQNEIESQIVEKKINFATNKDIELKTGFEGAKEFFINKKVIDIETYNQLNQTSKEVAFSVAKITDLTVSSHLKDLVAVAIDKGLDLETFKKQVDLLVEKTGITPLNPYYIETVFRTNILSTYNIGRYRAGIEDTNTVAWRYVTVNDSRLRPEHERLDGITAKKTDPIWNDIYPPNGYNCRGSVISLSDYYINNKPGFKFKPIDRKGAISDVDTQFRNNPTSLEDYDKMLKIEIKKKEKK